MIDYGAAIDSVKKSSKSELSSRFFGRLKFWTANFRTDGRGGFVGGAAASGPRPAGQAALAEASRAVAALALAQQLGQQAPPSRLLLLSAASVHA